ncbi:MAG TPA: hypothetical protein VEN79_18630 [Terriglobia bacterium]|nr:hypothetical protein [Terriglobia bacterium]
MLLRKVDHGAEKRRTDGATAVVPPHVEARFRYPRVTATVGNRTDRRPSDHLVILGDQQPRKEKMDGVPLLPTRRGGFEGGVAPQ